MAMASMMGPHAGSSASSVLVGVADGEGHDAGLGLEGPGVGVPAAAGVDRLDGELAGLGRVAGDGDGLQAQLLELKVTE